MISASRAAKGLLSEGGLYRFIVEHAGDGIYIASPDGLEYVNPAFKEITGLGPEEIDVRSMDFLKFVHPEDRSVVMENLRAGKEGRAIPARHEIRGLPEGGKPRHFEIDTTPLPGRPGRVLGILHDITERKQARDLEDHLQATLEKLRTSMHATTQAIAKIVEQRDPYTAGHQRRVADLGRAIAGELDLTGEQTDAIRLAGLLHDLGKIAIPAEILAKPTRLSDAELSLIRMHPRVAFEILKTIEYPWPIAEIIYQHHERIDGSGYPRGLAGAEILPEAKVLAVADVVEAMITDRPYRPARSLEYALDEIQRGKSVAFDGETVEACVRKFKEHGFSFRPGDPGYALPE